MNPPTPAELARKSCVPCEGGVPKFTPEQTRQYLTSTPEWAVSPDGTRIRREWVAKNFITAMDFLNRVAALAEKEGHHPDVHITGYRNVAIELYTHAIGGLSENDFILAAKIDELPIETRG